jgi:hypothetical protein
VSFVAERLGPNFSRREEKARANGTRQRKRGDAALAEHGPLAYAEKLLKQLSSYFDATAVRTNVHTIDEELLDPAQTVSFVEALKLDRE